MASVIWKTARCLLPIQAQQLALAVAQISSSAGGPHAFKAARRGPGLDSRDGASGGWALGASRYITDRAGGDAKAGAKPGDTVVGVDFDVTRRIRLDSEASSDERTNAGIGTEWEW